MSLPIYSQQAILNKEGDTTICFTIPQAKYLLKEHYKINMLDSLLSVCETQRLTADSVINNDTLMINKLKIIISNKDKSLYYKKVEVDSLNATIQSKEKALRREKLYKGLSIFAGGLMTAFLSFAYITK